MIRVFLLLCAVLLCSFGTAAAADDPVPATATTETLGSIRTEAVDGSGAPSASLDTHTPYSAQSGDAAQADEDPFCVDLPQGMRSLVLWAGVLSLFSMAMLVTVLGGMFRPVELSALVLAVFLGAIGGFVVLRMPVCDEAVVAADPNGSALGVHVARDRAPAYDRACPVRLATA